MAVEKGGMSRREISMAVSMSKAVSSDVESEGMILTYYCDVRDERRG
jgi:hypothetical protein